MVGFRRSALGLRLDRARVFSLLAIGAACARRDPASVRQEPANGGADNVATSATTTRSTVARGSAGLEDAAAPAPSATAAMPPPLSGDALVSLDVPGFQPAVVSIPLGTRTPRPIAVALHGNFDRPEWQCGVWRPIVGNRGFVLCPRGVPRRDVPKEMDRWEYASPRAFAGEIEAGVAALAARFGEHVDRGPLLFIGFSLGAIYGAPLVQREPARYPRAVLIEGGLGAWTPAAAKRFVAAGGQRLLIGCGQADCMTRSKRMQASLEKAGLATRYGGDARAGHTYDGSVASAVAENFTWLIEGDPRWQDSTVTNDSR